VISAQQTRRVAGYGAVLGRSFERALSLRMRSTSAMACAFWWAAWADGTISSDFAPSMCELQYGTTPSLEFGASPFCSRERAAPLLVVC